jgi:homoisocitrate dehydrogenase
MASRTLRIGEQVNSTLHVYSLLTCFTRKILEALPKSLGLDFSFVHLDAGFDEFKKNGVALPEKTVETLKKECDGALFGAVR